MCEVSRLSAVLFPPPPSEGAAGAWVACVSCVTHDMAILLQYLVSSRRARTACARFLYVSARFTFAIWRCYLALSRSRTRGFRSTIVPFSVPADRSCSCRPIVPLSQCRPIAMVVPRVSAPWL